MNKQPIIPSLVFLAILATTTACSKTPPEHLRLAQAAVQKADLKTAVIELKTVLSKEPDNREARLLLGKSYLDIGMYPDAEKELTQARKLGAADEQVLPVLAKTLLRMGEPKKALAMDVPASGLSSKALASLYATRAEAQMSLGDKALAEAAINAGKKVDPNHPELLLAQARLALVNKQKDQAAQFVDASLKSDPKFSDALYLKAGLLQSDGRDDEALKVYQQITTNDPSQYWAHLAISSLYQKKNNFEAADQAVKAAEKVAGKAPMVKYARGVLELRRGNLDKADSALQDVLRTTPGHLPTLLAYAMSSYGLGHYEQSINSAGKVLGAVPNNLPAAEILAGSLLKTGDVNGALKTLAPILPKYPDDPKLLALAGEIYLRAKDYNKAMAYLDRAAQLDPKNAMVKTSLAAGHLAEGDSDKALAELEQAAGLSDKPGQADLAIVMLHLKQKEYDQALQAIAALEKKLPNNPVTYNLRAAALLGKQDKLGARKALEQALVIKPDFFPAAVNLARLDMEENKPDAARKRFETILEKDKNNIQAMMALADLAAIKKNESEYVNWLEKAMKARPDAVKPRAALVRHHLAKKENTKALVLANEAVNNYPDSLEALSLLGATQLATGDRAAAITTFTRMAQKAPQSPGVLLELALAQIADKQLDKARGNLQQTLRLKPDFIQAQEALMQLELADKKPEAALQIARQIQIQQPKSPIGFDNEANILLTQSKYSQAVKAYEQALARGAGSSTLIKLHRALSLAGDGKAADQRLTAWIRQNPKDITARAYAAEYYMASNRNKDAIAQYEAVLKIAPQNALALNNLAGLYQREQDNRALATAEQAFKLAPENPSVQDTLGWILLDQGQLPRATELLAKAVATAPQAAAIRYHYGVALARNGNKADARKELGAAITSGQKFPELDEAKSFLKNL